MHNEGPQKFSFHVAPKILALPVFAICFCAILLLASSEASFATTAFAQDAVSDYQQAMTRIDELKTHISTREDEIKKLEEEIADYQNRLETVGSQKKTLQGAIAELNLTRSKLTKDIQLTKKQIEQTNSAITDLNASIRQKEQMISENKRLIGEIIHHINQNDSDTLIEILLGNDSVSSFLNELEDLERMQASIRDGIKSMERLRDDLAHSKKSYNNEQEWLIKLNGRLSDQKTIADQQQQAQNSLLAVTKNQESNYKKELLLREARKKQFEREIQDFEAQLRAEIDPNTFPPPGTKVLAYPVDTVAITQKFGKTVDARRLYESGTHNGIDFRATPGTPIKAAGDGLVVATGDTDKTCRGASYGKWVLIQHKNGLSTLYAHLELIKVSKDERLGVGDLVGYSGSTGYATGPHLHFALFVTSAVQIADIPSKSCKGAIFHIPAAPANGYLDPVDYL